MCDVNRINSFANELLNMELSDYKQLILEAESEEQRDLYFNLYEYVLQKRQEEVLKEHVY